jgi:Fe-S cluster assembly protein SufD
MARIQSQKGFAFTREMVEDSKGVPAVLRKYRKQAWRAYHDLPFPSLKDEAWNRTSLQGLKFGELLLPNGKPLGHAPDLIQGKILTEKVIGSKSLAFISPSGVEIKKSSEYKKSGLIIESLADAAENHPDLIDKILGKVVQPEEGKFAAAAGAFSKQGLFIYLPKGLKLDDPLYSISYAPWEGVAHFYQILIYLEAGSSLRYVHESLSPDSQSNPALAAENIEIIVGQNANLQFLELQSFGDQVWSFGHKRAQIEKDGNLEWEIGALGSILAKHFVSVDLVGQGAEGRVAGLFFADKNQHLSYNTLQRHLAPRTTSDLLFKGALRGKSRSVWRGMIYVAPGAQYIDGYQANRNLVLDRQARSDSIPGLEILNNDVRCTHGSTVGKIDPEQLFYLLSRGIPRLEAEQLIIQGFFDDVFSRYTIPEIREGLWEEIKLKLTSQ